MVLRLPDSWANWNLKMLIFEERGKLENPEKNLSEQGRAPTTNSTQIWRRRRDLNPGHIAGRWVLSPLRHPCSQLGSWLTFIGTISVRYDTVSLWIFNVSFKFKEIFLKRTRRGLSTPYNGLYGEAPPKRNTLFGLHVYKRVGIYYLKYMKK